MKRFFDKESVQIYFDGLYKKMKSEVDKMSNAEISSCNLQEWEDYLSDQYYVTPITLFETNIEKSIDEIKIKSRNLGYGNPGESEYFLTDGLRITFKIPFDGNPELFDLQPNYYVCKKYETENFVIPHGKECGSFTLYLEYFKKDLQDKGDNMNDFVQNQFERELSHYRTMITHINSGVIAYNKNLPSKARFCLEERKKKADTFSSISAALKIPLTPSKNAPNTTPIVLERVIRKPPSRPKVTPTVPEAYISDSDYENINNILWLCGTTMEKTSRTYLDNDEEELRDHLLAALNTHYDSASGETFRRKGKTDIHIEFENKAAFIGECKIWHGQEAFKKAIQQVIGYSTWRDLKVSVIIFNKENQAFQSVLDKIKDWAGTETVSHTQPVANRWNCKYYRQDENVDIDLTILAFNLR